MPMRRFPETPPPPPGAPTPSPGQSSPTAMGSASQPDDPAPPASALLIGPAAAPSSPQLQGAARELAQAAERTERSAREILSRSLALSEQLGKSLDRAERRMAMEGLGALLSGALLCASAAVLSTLVTLAAVFPRVTVLDLLRLILHRH